MITTDVVIVGAGPCGLFQVFELGLLGLKAEVVDSIPRAGGQCSELYPDKPIYDIPAIPVCTGEELTQSLLKQIAPFNCGMHLGEEVTEVEPRDGGFRVATSRGTEFAASAVVIAGGVGSFQPRQIRAEGAEDCAGRSLHYRVRDPEAFRDQRIVILGGGDSALDWVLALEDVAAHITLVHRRDEYRAMPASVTRMRELVASGRMDVIESAKATKFIHDNGDMRSLTVQPKAGGAPVEIEAEQALVFFGLAPKLGPIAEWGLDINRKTINVDTEKFETSTPGIHAVGDINHYPGKKKLILCGFHEAALAAFAIKQRIEPDKKVHVQYTTTSPIMHERLGVED